MRSKPQRRKTPTRSAAPPDLPLPGGGNPSADRPPPGRGGSDAAQRRPGGGRLGASPELIAAAVAARENAYAPYSGFRVGAALRDEIGAVHAGCNVENAASPEGLCAEASAIAHMVLAGARRAVELVVAGAGAALVTPCGGCRQRLREFAAGGLAIHVCNERGQVRATFTLDELLPASFGPANLGKEPVP